MRRGWAVGLLVAALCAAGCHRATSSVVLECGSIDAGSRTTLTTSERESVSCLTGGPSFGQPRTLDVSYDAPGPTHYRIHYVALNDNDVRVSTERNGTSVPNELRSQSERCTVLTTDAGGFPLTPPASCSASQGVLLGR